jgi:hypothetical protein
MSDTVKGFVVALENDLSEEQSEIVRSALEQIRGVAMVSTVNAAPEDGIIRMRVTAEMRSKFYGFMQKI